MKLFITAFIQVFLVSVQTYFIAHKFYYGVAILGFMISFVWTFNIQRIAFSGLRDKIYYSLGAGLGAISGLYLTVKMMNMFYNI